jgi:NADH-quinone oxidoreductase subunit G
LGIQLAPAAQRGAAAPLGWIEPPQMQAPAGGLLAVPITRLYDRGQTVLPSRLLQQRIPQPYIVLNPGDAGQRRITAGDIVEIALENSASLATIRLDEAVPPGIVLVPRSLNIPVSNPTQVEIRAVERARA